MPQATPEAEQFLRMLQVHNQKTDKIRKTYGDYCHQRIQAVQEGISFEQLQERLTKQGVADETKTVTKKKAKKGGVAAAKKKFAKQFNQNVGCQILVKGEDGQVVDFDDDEEGENNQDAENVMAPEESKVAVKKKKKVKKDAAKIGAEDTLDMIKNALKGAPTGKIVDELATIRKPSSAKPKKKKVKADKDKDEETKEVQDGDAVEDGEDKLSGDLEATSVATKSTTSKPKAAKKGKKGKKKANPVDSIARFFNDYGESPHLQAIETSYLMYLQAQYAKESHLKAVKRF